MEAKPNPSAKRKRRAAVGAVCLVIVALAMGWFVGRYIPGTPQSPESIIYGGMYDGNGHAAQKTVDTKFGQTASLEKITQGNAFYQDLRKDLGLYSENNEMQKEEIELFKQMGSWEYACADFDMAVKETRTVSADAFAELYPAYTGYTTGREDATMILITATLTNTSDTIISNRPERYGSAKIPEVKLWTDWSTCYADNLVTEGGSTYTVQGPVDASVKNYAESTDTPIESKPLSDGTLGSGAMHDLEAFMLINDPVFTDTLASGESVSEHIHLEPGESQTIVFPFTLPNSALGNPVSTKQLDLSQFCIQIPDFATGTAYRLWLG